MNGVLARMKVLLLMSVALHFITQGESVVDDDTDYYCQICENHTMCRFPYDDSGPNCANIENGDLDDEEIRWILHWHNSFREEIAKRWKNHGTTGVMMQVFWDDELARIARRWVLQCNIHDKDECRNTERFLVIQNVNALDLEEVGNHSALERLEFHMKTWYDQLDFEENTLEYSQGMDSSILGFATLSLNSMGCGRATYNVDLYEGEKLSRVEALVCNYGPKIDGAFLKTEKDVSKCQIPSPHYPELCTSAKRKPTKCHKQETDF